MVYAGFDKQEFLKFDMQSIMNVNDKQNLDISCNQWVLSANLYDGVPQICC